MLAAKILMEQGISVTGICFKSNFYSADKAKTAAKALGIELIIDDISREILELVKNPPSGYGKHLNPCVDCHSLMIKKAGEYLTPQPPLLAKERGGGAERSRGEVYNFIATGEVLGQRPFSQNPESLDKVMKLSGVDALRPLSAKLLKETEVEKNGLVKRNRLLDIKGRSRERQLELARKYNLKAYATPAGGCLLTDPGFSERLMKMLDYWPDCDILDIELLKMGRIFWLKEKEDRRVLIIVGRHQQDNENLEKTAIKNDILMELKDINGPTALIRMKHNSGQRIFADKKYQVPKNLKKAELKLGEDKSREEIVDIAALLTGYYSIKARGKEVDIIIKRL